MWLSVEMKSFFEKDRDLVMLVSSRRFRSICWLMLTRFVTNWLSELVLLCICGWGGVFACVLFFGKVFGGWASNLLLLFQKPTNAGPKNLFFVKNGKFGRKEFGGPTGQPRHRAQELKIFPIRHQKEFKSAPVSISESGKQTIPFQQVRLVK